MPILSWKRTILVLLLFGSAFGYLEAAVVSYLRDLNEPARQRIYPGRSPSELFPLLTLDQLRATAQQQRTLAIEIGREAATIIMLAAAALLVANAQEDDHVFEMSPAEQRWSFSGHDPSYQISSTRVCNRTISGAIPRSAHPSGLVAWDSGHPQGITKLRSADGNRQVVRQRSSLILFHTP
jgi:hypothetical protein